jgi:hypothetical protein
MPRAARKKKDEIDPDSLWVCWMSGSAEVDGQNVSFHEGQRLRGDSPAVQGCPQYFVADGTPASERPNTFGVLVERADAERAAVDFEVTLSGPLPEPLASEDTIRLTRSVTVRGGYVSNQEVVTFDKGTVFSVRSEIAGLLPADAYEHAEIQFTRAKGRRR